MGRINSLRHILCASFSIIVLLFLLLGNQCYAQCNGTPTAGSISGNTTVCATATAAFTLNGASTGSGISYQWQSSTDGSTWKNISNATGTTYNLNVPASFTGEYLRVNTTCSNSNQTVNTTAVKLTLPVANMYAQLPYALGFEDGWQSSCVTGALPAANWNNIPLSGNNAWRREDDGISALWSGDPSFGAYTPAGSAGSNHSARFHSTYATKGMLDVYINANTAGAGKVLSFDYINTDGTDSLEIMVSTDGGTSFTKLNGFHNAASWSNKLVFFSSKSSTAIIRFIATADNGNSDIGIDNINISEGIPCSGTPAVGSIQSSDTAVCSAMPFKLGLTKQPGNNVGIAYQWQSSVDNTTWININNATDSILNITESASTYYKVTTSCLVSGISVTSKSLFITAPSPMAGSYTINKTKPTAGNNFASFNDAYNALQCAGVNAPVVFNVVAGSGPYTEQLIIDSIRGANATNTITFNGNGNTIKFTSHNTNERAVIKLHNAAYFNFINCIIDARPADNQTPAYGIGVHLLNNADNNTFRNCHIITDSSYNASTNFYGVVIGGNDNGPNLIATSLCDNNTFDKDTIIGGNIAIAMQSGIIGVASSGTVLTNNYFTGYTSVGVELYGNANTLIDSNTFHYTRKSPGAVINIYLMSNCTNTMIVKNRFDCPSDGHPAGQYFTYYGITDIGSTGTQITNNLLYNISMPENITCIKLQRTDALVYHNTIDIHYSYTGQPASVNYTNAAGIVFGLGSGIATVKNNLISLENKSSYSTAAILCLPGGPTQFTAVDYNDYYLSGTGVNNIGSIPGNTTDYKTLSDWNTATGADANTVTINPAFEKPSAGDYLPTSATLDNKGTPVGVFTDIVNTTRSRIKPDIGCYEFSICSPLHGAYTIDASATFGTDRTFLSFNEAYNALQCGIDSAVIFNVVAVNHVYNEQLNMEAVKGASALNTVTFKGNGNIIRYSSSDENYRAVIRLKDAHYIIFDSLIIDATPPSDQYTNRWGYGVQLYNKASYNTFHACSILTDSITDHFSANSYQNYMGIVLKGNSDDDSVNIDHNTFSNNNISGGYYSMFQGGRAVATSIIKNNITGFNTYGIILQWPYRPDFSDSVLITENNIWHTHTGLVGIHVAFSNNIVISKNIIHDITSPAVDGIRVENSNSDRNSKTYITNNLLYNLGRDSTDVDPTYFIDGITIGYGMYSLGSTYVLHNTVSLHNYSRSTDTTLDWENGFLYANFADTSNIVFKNNLVYISGNGKGHFFAVNTPAPASNGAVNAQFDHNDYYIQGSNPLNFIARYNTGTYVKTLKDWQAITNKDAASLSVDPVFQNAAKGNYIPTSLAFDNKGIPVGIKDDIVDAIRSTTTPDIGCFEFIGCTRLKGLYTIDALATVGANRTYLSFNNAYDALKCGIDSAVIFNVVPTKNPYVEQLNMQAINGASGKNTVTFKGNGDTLRYNSLDENYRAVIQFNGTSHFIFDSLVIDATPPAAAFTSYWGYGVQMFNDADSNTLHACTILTDSLFQHLNWDSRNAYQGIVLSGNATTDFVSTDYNVFDHNKVAGGSYGIHMLGHSVKDSFIHNSVSGFLTFGILLDNDGGNNDNAYNDSLWVEGNEVHHAPYGLDAIYVSNSDNTVITKNIVHDIKSSAIQGIMLINANSDNHSKTIVTNNLIYDLGRDTAADNPTLFIDGINNVSPYNVIIEHNTIALKNNSPNNGAAINGIHLGYVLEEGETMNVVCENNLISIIGKGKGGGNAMQIYPWQDGYYNDFHLDYNNYYLDTSTNNNIGLLMNESFSNITYLSSMTDWRTQTKLDSNSLTVNPLFENAAGGDYIPTSIPMDNMGTPVGVLTDIRDAIRSTVKPDIGAYEFIACTPLHGLYTIDALAAAGTNRNFVSFNDAYDALHCGIDSAVIFNVVPTKNPYNEQLNMEAILGSSAKNTVTFNGNADTLRYSSTDENSRAVIQFKGTQHVILDSLIIDARPPIDEYDSHWGNGIQMYNNADSNIIHACTILTDTLSAHFDRDGGRRAYNGIVLMGNNNESVSTDNNLIDHNKIVGGYFGIELDGKAALDSFMYNEVNNFYFYGISLQNENVNTLGANDSLFVEGNDVHHTTTGLDGIYVSDANNTMLLKNKIHDMKSQGVSAIVTVGLNTNDESKTIITNNLMYDLGRDDSFANPTFFVYGIHQFSNGNFIITHNTIALSNISSYTLADQIGYSHDYLPDASTIIQFENNLITLTGPGAALSACVELVNKQAGNAVGVYKFNYNNYYIDSNKNNSTGILNGSFVSSFADWKTQATQDGNSVSIAPLYTNPSIGNYKPTNKLMDNLGVPVGVLDDILDVTRSLKTPDIGAYEFDVCPAKFAWFKASNMQPCIGENVLFTSVDTLPDGSAVDTWNWDFGNSTTSTINNPSAAYTAAGSFNVKLSVATAAGCKDDTTQAIKVIDCYKELFIPNAFTPNGDGLNDVLKVYGTGVKEITMMIFNQWGEKLYESHDQSKGWDGTQNGRMQPSGVYMYVCKIIMTDGREIIKKGSVNLIR